jgi:hypothetical protein
MILVRRTKISASHPASRATLHLLQKTLTNLHLLDHHFQVTLRNTDSETSFIWNLFQIALAHKGAQLQTYKRSAWLILLAVLHGLSFSIAGGLSSRFVVASDQIQALPGKCGWIVEVPFVNITNNTVFEQAISVEFNIYPRLLCSRRRKRNRLQIIHSGCTSIRDQT